MVEDVRQKFVRIYHAPNAATVACRRLRRRTCSKKATSFSFESGYPPYA